MPEKQRPRVDKAEWCKRIVGQDSTGAQMIGGHQSVVGIEPIEAARERDSGKKIDVTTENVERGTVAASPTWSISG